MLSDERRLSHRRTLVVGRDAGRPLRASVAVAYGDLQRTLHGVQRLRDGAGFGTVAHTFLESAIARLLAGLPMSERGRRELPAELEAWHHAAVGELRTI